MSKELDDAYFRSTPCTHHEPLLSKLVDCVNLLEERIKGLLGATVSVGETKTLPAGSEATAKAGKRGYDTVLDFGIPRGEKGDKGEPGAKGDPGEPGSDATATDVRIDGKSITKDGVADIPPASNSSIGLVRGYTTGGLYINDNGIITTYRALDSDINTRESIYKPIVPSTVDYAVKAAMCDGKGKAWTSNERKAAQKRLGIDTTAPSSRIWFSHQEPGTDIETSGYFIFKLAALESSDMLNPTEYVKEFDMIFWNGYAYFVQDNDGTSAGGDTRFEFAPHKA